MRRAAHLNNNSEVQKGTIALCMRINQTKLQTLQINQTLIDHNIWLPQVNVMMATIDSLSPTRLILHMIIRKPEAVPT